MNPDRRKLLRSVSGITGGALLVSGVSSASSASSQKRSTRTIALSAPVSANDVEFVPDGVGAVIRSVQEKERDIVHASDWGLLGDGSDETTKLQNLLDAAAGKLLLLGTGKTYGFTGTLLFPDKTTLIANGSSFKRLSVDQTEFAIIIGADTLIDSVALQTVGLRWDPDPGIMIQGSRVQIGRIQVHALTEGSGGDAVMIGTNIQNSPIREVQIGYISATNYRAPVALFEVHASTIGFFDIFKYERGIYIRDCQQLVLRGGCLHSIWPGADGSAGENGVLIESVKSDYACRDVFIHNIVVKISGEHGFRIGGSLSVKNIHHIGCASYMAGSGSSPVGGSGFKALGWITNGTPHLHEDLYYVDCYVEDAGQENSNWSGFILGLCKGVTLEGCRVRKNLRPFSCMDGIWFDSSINVDASNCSALDCRRWALRVSAETSVDSHNIQVNGGHYHVGANGFGDGKVIYLTCVNGNVRNLTTNAIACSGGALCLRAETPPGAYNYLGCSFDLTYRDPYSMVGGPPFQVGSNISLRVNAPWYGSYSPGGANGSVYQDITRGLFLVRKAAGWVAV